MLSVYRYAQSWQQQGVRSAREIIFSIFLSETCSCKIILCIFATANQGSASARMAKLVDALVSGASAERLAGSSPVPGTKRGIWLNELYASFLFGQVRLDCDRIHRPPRSKRGAAPPLVSRTDKAAGRIPMPSPLLQTNALSNFSIHAVFCAEHAPTGYIRDLSALAPDSTLRLLNFLPAAKL